MRRLAALVALALAAVACGGESSPAPSTSPPITVSATVSPSPSPSPTPTSSPSPTLETPARIELPADAPTTLEQPLDPEQIATRDYADLAPPGATIDFTWILSTPDDPFDQLAFAWRRGDDPFAMEQGFVVWRRFEDAPPWRVVYAFTDPSDEGVLGISLQTEDLTGDGIQDVLTFEDTGGSGACGTFRVIATAESGAEQIWKRTTCDTQVRPADGDLVVREAVFETGDAHCCPSAFRTTTLRWNGETWDVVSRETTPA